MIKQLVYLLLLGLALLGLVMLFTYDIIKIDWISMMELQSSYKPMEKPLGVPAGSIPVEGAAYIAGVGVPVNPVSADEISLLRGAELYKINCVICHGEAGKGDGVIGTFFEFKPADLTSDVVQQTSDGSMFMVISTGVEGRMPPLNENLSVRERWDVVNYIRTLGNSGTP